MVHEVEAIGDGVAQRCLLHRIVEEPQTAKVFQQCFQCLDHLDDNHGDKLLGKTVPSTAGSDPLGMLHGAGFVWKSGREGNASVDGMGSPSQMCTCI
jgi:hypothetical protein